jgi:hypothetical protein
VSVLAGELAGGVPTELETGPLDEAHGPETTGVEVPRLSTGHEPMAARAPEVNKAAITTVARAASDKAHNSPRPRMRKLPVLPPFTKFT